MASAPFFSHDLPPTHPPTHHPPPSLAGKGKAGGAQPKRQATLIEMAKKRSAAQQAQQQAQAQAQAQQQAQEQAQQEEVIVVDG